MISRVSRSLSAAVALLFAGCDAPSGPSAVALRWPLDVGTRWTYEHVVSSDVYGVLWTDTMVVTVTGDTVANGVRWAIVDDNPLVVAGTVASPQYLTLGPTGLWLTWSLDCDYGPVLCPSGDPWGEAIFDSPAVLTARGRHSGKRITALTTAVHVPAGSYRCVRFEGGLREPGRTDTDCVAPGVGLVFAEHYAGSSTDGTTVQHYTSTARLVRFESATRPQGHRRHLTGR
jgi:hypothetical protein